MTRVRGSKQRVERKTVVSDSDFSEILKRIDEIKDKFFRLRAKCLLCVLRLTGKRRGEVATVALEGVKIENNFLNLTFTLEKKRKGHVLTKQSTKTIPLTDPYTKPVLEYLEYLKRLDYMPKFLFPRVQSVFGHNIILLDRHIGGRQVFNVVRSATDKVWPHLFRETVASDVIKGDSSIIGAFKVMRRLDLEDHRTGFKYLQRYASDVIRREIEKVEKSQA